MPDHLVALSSVAYNCPTSRFDTPHHLSLYVLEANRIAAEKRCYAQS